MTTPSKSAMIAAQHLGDFMVKHFGWSRPDDGMRNLVAIVQGAIDSEQAMKLTELLQSEYDRHMAKYRKGCIACMTWPISLRDATTIRDLASLLHIELVEAEETKRTKAFPPNAAR